MIRRVLIVIVLIGFCALGLLFGQLNPDPVVVDFHFYQSSMSVAITLLLAMAFGALFGGLLVFLGSTLPARLHQRRASRQASRLSTEMAKVSHQDE